MELQSTYLLSEISKLSITIDPFEPSVFWNVRCTLGDRYIWGESRWRLMNRVDKNDAILYRSWIIAWVSSLGFTTLSLSTPTSIGMLVHAWIRGNKGCSISISLKIGSKSSLSTWMYSCFCSSGRFWKEFISICERLSWKREGKTGFSHWKGSTFRTWYGCGQQSLRSFLAQFGLEFRLWRTELVGWGVLQP